MKRVEEMKNKSIEEIAVDITNNVLVKFGWQPYHMMHGEKIEVTALARHVLIREMKARLQELEFYPSMSYCNKRMKDLTVTLKELEREE